MTTILEVLAADHQKNHAGREYDLEETLRRFGVYAAQGKPYFTHGKVIIIFNAVTEECVEFHCLNGGDGRDLSSAVIEFLGGMKKLFKTAVTYYDNPRVSEIIEKFSPYTVVVERIDGGLDKTYSATFSLGA